MLNTEGTALFFESKWLLYPPFGSPPTPALSCPPPIDSIRDIAGVEKTIRKTSSIQVASRINYEMIAI